MYGKIETCTFWIEPLQFLSTMSTFLGSNDVICDRAVLFRQTPRSPKDEEIIQSLVMGDRAAALREPCACFAQTEYGGHKSHLPNGSALSL